MPLTHSHTCPCMPPIHSHQSLHATHTQPPVPECHSLRATCPCMTLTHSHLSLHATHTQPPVSASHSHTTTCLYMPLTHSHLSVHATHSPTCSSTCSSPETLGVGHLFAMCSACMSHKVPRHVHNSESKQGHEYFRGRHRYAAPARGLCRETRPGPGQSMRRRLPAPPAIVLAFLLACLKAGLARHQPAQGAHPARGPLLPCLRLCSGPAGGAAGPVLPLAAFVPG